MNKGYFSCFVDDTLVFLTASSEDELQQKFQEMEFFVKQLKRVGLDLEASKAEILVYYKFREALSKKKINRNFGKILIYSLKYHGTHLRYDQIPGDYILDSKLRFGHHLTYLPGECCNIFLMFNKIFRNTSGYSNNCRRIMLKGVIDV